MANIDEDAIPTPDETSDDTNGSSQPTPPRSSTATAPVGDGPIETTTTPVWDTQNQDPITQYKELAHAFGADKDYFQEARNLLPAPPSLQTSMPRAGWAALLPGVLLAAAGGGAPGLNAAGRALSTVGSTEANNAMTNWQNQYRYAQGLGSIANQMSERGQSALNSVAPYAMMRQADIARTQQEQMALQARVAQWNVGNQFTAQRINNQLSQINGMNQYHDQIAKEAQARDAATVAWRQYDEAMKEANSQSNEAARQQSLQLAAQRLALAQHQDEIADGLRGQLIQIAAGNLQSHADTNSMNAARSILASLTYEAQSLEQANPNDPKLESIQSQIDTLRSTIGQMGNVPTPGATTTNPNPKPGGMGTLPALGGGINPKAQYTITGANGAKQVVTGAQIQAAIRNAEQKGLTRAQIVTMLQKEGLDPNTWLGPATQ